MDYERVRSNSSHGSSNEGDGDGELDERALQTLNALHSSGTSLDGMTDQESCSSSSVSPSNISHTGNDKALSRSAAHDSSNSLASNASDMQDGDEDEHDEGEDLDESSPATDKVRYLMKSAWPVVTSFFLSIMGGLILMLFAGHAPESNGLAVATVFAGVSLSNLYCNVTFRSLIIGMTGAVETLGSQNNGAKRYADVGYTLQRSIVVLSATSLLSVGAWWNAGAFFLWAGIDPAVCDVVKNVVRIRMLEMPISSFNESYEKYCMSIGVMKAPMYANMALNVSVTILSYLFMFVLHFDYRSLAVAWVISVAVAGCMMVYISSGAKAVKRTLQPWNWDEALDYPKLKRFFELGLPGTAMLCSEWWAYEILTIFAGRLGTNEVSAETIIMQLAALAFMFPLGLSVATASIVGNALGSKKREYAIQMSHYAILTIIGAELCLGVLMRLFGRFFCSAFTDDAGVLETTFELIIFLSIFCIVDGLQGVCSGVLRGAGQQTVGACCNVFSFYVLGLPCAWFLCFNEGLRVPGLMVGISSGTSFQVLCLCYLIYRTPDYIFQYQLKDESSNSNDEGAGDGGGGKSRGGAAIQLGVLRGRGVADMDSSSAPLSLSLGRDDSMDDIDILVV